MITVVVVDDQSSIINLFRIHFESLSDISLVGFAKNGRDAIQVIHRVKPDIVLMDMEMPIINGIEATKILTQRCIDTKVILLTTHNDVKIFSLALKTGVKGIVPKNSDLQDIDKIIHLVKNGFYQFKPVLNSSNPSQSTSLNIFQNTVDFYSRSMAVDQSISSIIDSINEIRNNVALNQEQIALIADRHQKKSFKKLVKQKNKDYYPKKYLINLSHLGNDSFFITGFIAGMIVFAALFYLLTSMYS